MAAYNPKGAEAPGTPGRDEGYLYWLSWLAHDANSVFQAQDAQRRLPPDLLHGELRLGPRHPCLQPTGPAGYPPRAPDRARRAVRAVGG